MRMNTLQHLDVITFHFFKILETQSITLFWI